MKKLILADHDVLALRRLTSQVRSLGCENVVPCTSGRDAVTALERDAGAVGLVVCDLQMPGMGGPEVLKHLARLDYRGRIALLKPEDDGILASALEVARQHRLDVVAALQRPINVEMVAGVLGGASWFVAHGERRGAPVDAARDSNVGRSPDALRKALIRGQLLNAYQPKVEVRTGAVTGVEALVRWRYPGAGRQGMLLPDDFVATAEEHGMIALLTRVVLNNALDQARRWREAGLSVDVAVNVSMDNLADASFPDMVEDEARAHGIPLAALTLEVTESRSLVTHKAPTEVLSRLKLRRVALSIDDFGMGQSALTKLGEVPFDELKIDRCFVHGAARDPRLRDILTASCEVARHLHMRVVAEGVEDQADWDVVREVGCDVAQGHFFAPPMRGESIPAWIDDWRAPP